MDLIWGLPAHPLTVHAPIVLIPLVTLGAIIIAMSATLRYRYDILTSILAVAAMVSTFFANQAGEAFTERLGLEEAIEKHEGLAGTTLVLTVALTVMILVNVGAARLEATRNSTLVTSVLPVVSACLGVLATIWMVRTGHEGATLVWENVVE